MENFNGLVRQSFPKGSAFGEISSSTHRRVEDEIKQRPRKVLRYKLIYYYKTRGIDDDAWELLDRNLLFGWRP